MPERTATSPKEFATAYNSVNETDLHSSVRESQGDLDSNSPPGHEGHPEPQKGKMHDHRYPVFQWNVHSRFHGTPVFLLSLSTNNSSAGSHALKLVAPR